MAQQFGPSSLHRVLPLINVFVEIGALMASLRASTLSLGANSCAHQVTTVGIHSQTKSFFAILVSFLFNEIALD